MALSGNSACKLQPQTGIFDIKLFKFVKLLPLLQGGRGFSLAFRYVVGGKKTQEEMFLKRSKQVFFFKKNPKTILKQFFRFCLKLGKGRLNCDHQT